MNKSYEAIIKLAVLAIYLITYTFFPSPALAMDKHKVEKNIEINAPIKEVFSYTTNPKNLPSLMPSMRSVSNISPPTPGLGQNWYWEYKLLGTTLRGRSRVVKFNPPERYVVQSEEEGAEGSPDLWTYTLSTTDTGTEVTLKVEYTISRSSVATKVANRVFIQRKIRSEVQNSLGKLKTIMEKNRYQKSGGKSLEAS